jgi:hypothetical protein
MPENVQTDEMLLRLQIGAESDQNQAALVDLAKCSGAFFRELRQQGFRRDEALEMVAAWHDMMYTIQIRATVGEA